MEQEKETKAHVSPEKCLWVFTRGKIVLWTAVAIALHVIIIGMLSLGYIRDRWIDPDGAKLRKIAAEAAKKKEKDQVQLALEKAAAMAAAAKTNALPGTNVVAGAVGGTNAPSTNAVSSSSAGLTEDEKILKTVTNTPMGQRLTAVAATNELPAQPKDLGISIEDTNLR